ncbi:TPA: sigma-70 family RNA polymerase sigma factor [Streptococcus suis]
MFDDLSNEEIVVRLQECFDDALFEELHYRFKPMFQKSIRDYRIRNFDDEDYLQEGRISLHEAIKHFDSKQKYYFSSYFHRIYKNNLINHLRHELALKHIPYWEMVSLEAQIDFLGEDASDYYLADVLADKQTTIHDTYVARENFVEFLSSLSNLERNVLYHRMMEEDNSANHIAGLMEVDRRVVENALARCWRKSKNILK